jgi:biopolymer transport protein ExbD
MIHIERQFRRARTLPLTSLVDILCCLLFFFMLSTSFVRQESMELMMPSDAAKRDAKQQVMYIYVSDNGEVFLGNKSMGMRDLSTRLVDEFEKNVDQHIMVLVSEKVSVQTMVTVLDKIYLTGARNISVADWKM